MKKILVPTDFSKPAEWAVETATNIARRTGGEVLLLHIVEQPTKESYNVEGQVNNLDNWEDKLFTLKLIERNKKQLLELETAIQAKGVAVRQILKLGNPFHGITSVITDQKVELVVMGTSSRSKIEEMTVGSNTEKVVRHSKCPVLSVHQKPVDNGFKNIVYATAMSEEEKAFSKVITSVQEIDGATVHVVRINTPMNFRPDKDVNPVMEAFVKKLKLKDYTLNVFNDFSEEEGILHFANKVNADLIAMATHGRTGFAHVLVGSIAEDVVNHSTKPVLTFITPKQETVRYF